MSRHQRNPESRLLTIAEKQARVLESAREPSVVCPICETHTTARDLVAHLSSRCAGPRAPHPGSAWVTFAEALALGVPRATLSRWVRTGIVRTRGDVQDRRYLLRDLTAQIAARTAARRRKFHARNRTD